MMQSEESKKVKSIVNIREAQKIIREEEKATANLWPPCISIPFVWCSHEHCTLPRTGKCFKNSPCLDPCGRALQEGMRQTPVPNNCQWYTSRGKSGENLCRHLCCVITTTESGDSCSSSPYNILVVLVVVPALQLVLGILLCLVFFFCFFFPESADIWNYGQVRSIGLGSGSWPPCAVNYLLVPGSSVARGHSSSAQ